MNVLICVDFSTHTENILVAAKSVIGARLPTPEITVLHVIDERQLIAGTGAEPVIEADLEKDGQQISNMVKSIFGQDANYLQRAGIPILKIDEVLDEGGFDLLVFGSKGRSGVVNMLFGSVARHLMHRTKIPMLVVPC